uniref:HEAT repeat-containing protein 1 n=1 Tax=Ditylenchus dipsaci TaxID=166011 RepID=A0A915DU63_9BILA
MTSLALQLKRLKTAETHSLSVGKDRSSLLFDSKQAAAYNQNDFYELGISGLEQLKKFDDQFDRYETDLFDKSSLSSNRALLGVEENIELNEMLERFIIRLSPYFHLQACKQVLEWFVYKYQVHRFNAELLFFAFLPYHSSNSFGRLLRILKLSNKPEWTFLDEFARSGSPIPMNVLIKVCFANYSYFLVSSLSNFFVKAVKAVGEEYAQKSLHSSFTFYTIFMLNLLEDSSKLNDQLIARLMPYIGIALRSSVLPFNITKLVLSKIQEPWADVALDTVAFICQTQDISTLPGKSIVRLARKCDSLQLMSKLQEMASSCDISYLLVALWNTLRLCLKTGVNDVPTAEDCENMLNALKENFGGQYQLFGAAEENETSVVFT